MRYATVADRKEMYKQALRWFENDETYRSGDGICIALWRIPSDPLLLWDKIPIAFPEFAKQKPRLAEYGRLWWPGSDREKRIQVLKYAIALCTQNIVEP